ncbi:MAG: hypothetical protein WCZ17_01690 [Candidatus Kapaibacterium sp.]
MSEKIILIEICGSHDECIYAQAQVFKRLGYDVLIIASDDLSDRFTDYDIDVELEYFSFSKNRLNNLSKLFKIKKLIKNVNPAHIQFNTASNSLVMDLLFLLGKKYSYSGIIHSLKKLTEGTTQKIINRYIKKYFVLNDFLLDFIPKLTSAHEFESFYTASFPYNFDIHSRDDSIFKICIPGNVEYKRRDYLYLTELAKSPNLNPNVVFEILGNSKHRYSCGNDLKEKVKHCDSSDRFIFHDNFIEPYKFHKNVQSSDLIMPLLHPNVEYYESYLTNQISGTYNLSFAYRIPMLISKPFDIVEDIRNTAFFYDSIEECISQINRIVNNKHLLRNEKFDDYISNKLNLDTQAIKINDFLFKK